MSTIWVLSTAALPSYANIWAQLSAGEQTAAMLKNWGCIKKECAHHGDISIDVL